MKKTMTRGQHLDHLAVRAVATLRKEQFVKPVSGYAYARRDAASADLHACRDCGYHVCSCTEEVRAYVQCDGCPTRMTTSIVTTIKEPSVALKKACEWAEKQALDLGWVKAENRHYCPSCHKENTRGMLVIACSGRPAVGTTHSWLVAKTDMEENPGSRWGFSGVDPYLDRDRLHRINDGVLEYAYAESFEWCPYGVAMDHWVTQLWRRLC